MHRHPSLRALVSLIVAALLSWSLFHWLTVQRPDRSVLISDSVRYADVGRSLSRQQGYIDRLITPLAAANFRAGPPHPSTHWSPLYPALTGMWLGTTGGRDATIEHGAARYDAMGAVLVGAVGFLAALVALYALGLVVLGRPLAWIPPLAMALDPDVLALANDGLSEGWFTAFCVLALTFVMAPGRSGHHVAAGGLMLAMAQLTRVNAIAYAPVLAFLAARPPAGARWSVGAARTRRPEHTGRALAWLQRGGELLLGDHAARGPTGALLFLGFFTLTLLPWLLFRADMHGSMLFEPQRFNLLHDLGPWQGAEVYRSIQAPEPLLYVLTHPWEMLGKIITGAIKLAVLVPGAFLHPLELVLIVIGAGAMLRDPLRRRALFAILALLAVQLLLSSMTLLDRRLVLPVLVLLWIPMAAGAEWLARRLLGALPRLGLALVLVTAVGLPFARTCLEAYLEPALGTARFTEEDARGLGAWTDLLVPHGHSVLTDLEEMVWYADRPVVWMPLRTAEIESLRLLTGVRYALWRTSPAAGSPEEDWRRYFERELKRGAIQPLGELRLESGAYVIAAWE